MHHYHPSPTLNIPLKTLLLPSPHHIYPAICSHFNTQKSSQFTLRACTAVSLLGIGKFTHWLSFLLVGSAVILFYIYPSISSSQQLPHNLPSSIYDFTVKVIYSYAPSKFLSLVFYWVLNYNIC